MCNYAVILFNVNDGEECDNLDQFLSLPLIGIKWSFQLCFGDWLNLAILDGTHGDYWPMAIQDGAREDLYALFN